MSDFLLDPDSISANSTDPDAILNLNVDDLNWQGQQSTSLCDRFQIHMFTEKFKQSEEQVRQEEKKSCDTVLLGIMADRDKGKDEETEQIFQTVMAADGEAVIKFDYSQNTGESFDISAYLYILGEIVIAGAVLWLVERKRRKKGK